MGELQTIQQSSRLALLGSTKGHKQIPLSFTWHRHQLSSTAMCPRTNDFPEDVRGSDSRIAIVCGTLKFARLPRRKMSNSFGAIAWPFRGTQQHRSPGPTSDQGWQKPNSLLHVWKAVDQVLHLGGVHVKAAGDDHIVTPTKMMK